jgi:transposase
VRVGMEATGYSRWFEQLLAGLGFEVWMGDPAEIPAKRNQKQKTDRNDARLLPGVMRKSERIHERGTLPTAPPPASKLFRLGGW